MPKVLPEYLEQRRNQILEAAARCFSETGFHLTSIDDICRCADLSPGAVYRYFKGKEDLIAAICDDSANSNLALIESIKARGEAHEVMEELARTFLDDLTQDNVRLTVDMLAEVPRSAHIQENVARGNHAIEASFAAFIRAAQEQGDVSSDLDPEAIAQVMCALYHGFIVQKQINPHVDADKFIQAVMEIFNGAFFTRPAPRPGVSSSANS